MDRRSNHLLLDACFDDVDELTGAIHGWGVELLQLEAGPFRSRIRQWHAGSLFFAHAKFGRKLSQRGASPVRALSIGVPARDDFELRWRGQDASSRDIMVLPEDGELDAVSTDSFDVFTVSIPEPAWGQLEAKHGLVGAITERQGRLCRCSARSMSELRAALRRLEAATVAGGWHAGVPIPALVLAALRSGDTSADAPRGADRRRILRVATRVIDSRHRGPIRMDDLCRAVGASERTIQYAFRAEFGVTPIEFVRLRRLDRARRELRRASPSRGAVARIARACGFRHGGQFAADYLKHIGEHPSTTLRRDPRLPDG